MNADADIFTDPKEYLPLSPRDFQVLLIVFDRPMHGYGIVKVSEEELDRTVLDLGSLYRIIGRLIEKGLIDEVTENQDDGRKRRRYYQATELGRRVTRAEAARLRALLQSERASPILENP